jgi:hypothetical protein
MGLFNDLFGSPKPINNKPQSQPSPSGALVPSFAGGKYKIIDPRMSDSDAVFRMAKELQDTFQSFDTCLLIAQTIRDCRGGSGITKDELKNEIYKLEDQEKLTKDQVNAALRRLNIY